MPCVHVFRSANHQLGLYLRRMFVPRSKNVVSNAGIHDVGGLKSTAKVSLYDHDYGPSYYARCHKVVAQCTVLLYVRHGLELGCSSWSVFSTDGDRREHRFFVLETCGHRRKTSPVSTESRDPPFPVVAGEVEYITIEAKHRGRGRCFHRAMNFLGCLGKRIFYGGHS